MIDSLEIRSNGTFLKKDTNYYYFVYSNNLYRISINDLSVFESIKDFTDYFYYMSEYYYGVGLEGINIKFFQINNYNILLFGQMRVSGSFNKDFKIFAFIFNSDFSTIYKYMSFSGLMNDDSKFNFLSGSLYFYLSYSYIEEGIPMTFNVKERIYQLKLNDIFSDITKIDEFNWSGADINEQPEGNQLNYEYIFQDSILEENNTTETIKTEIIKQVETAKQEIQSANTTDIVNELKKINNSLIMLLEVM